METTLNFEKVWQLFQETDRKFKETDRKFQETQRALDRKFQETDRKFQETDKRMKALQDLFEGQWGKLMESLVEGDLVHLLKGRGVRINNTSTRCKGSRDGESYEFDIIAHNGEEIVIVEVKTTLRVGQVEKFIKRLHRAKHYLPEYRAYRVLGAMAYLRAEQASDQYAQNQGLFVIRATGDSAAIVNPAGFQPRKFG
ncbi:YraN family protein [Candidatus Thiosymbion oneisti]|uniref:YraN family protein n=1 Tax=Candidatus Thiosymbion oneisti TaxID=589554 RepID=UPI000A6EC061|nr:YraN family protein [Candidatus Thiosymbion oneisti]